MDKTWWRITQVIFVPLIVAILFTTVREIVLWVSGDATVTTNGIHIYNEPFTYTNDVIYMSNGVVLFRTNFPQAMLKQSLYVTNSPTFSAHDLIFKAKSNGELTNLVNELVTSGEFCAVRGHVWRNSTQRWLNELQSDLMPLPKEEAERRTCGVCGSNQFRSMPAWPTP